MYFCSVTEKKLTYYPMHTNLCGTPSKREGFSVTQFSPHRPYTDATDPSGSSVRSFSTKIPTHGRNYKSVETVDNNMVSEAETQRENNATMTTPQEVFIISRDIYNKAIADKKLLKALAFAISAKSIIRCSVAKHPTMKQLASLVGVSEYRAKRAIDTLMKYGYAEYDERGNLRFKRIKYRFNNICLKGINTDSYQSAYTGLHAAAICDLIQKTEFVRQQLITKEKPNPRPTKAQKRHFNRAVRYCNQQGIHSLSDFSQNGYSYNLICKKYHFSKREVSAAVKYGVKNKMFSADNTLCVLGEYKNKNVAITALETMQDLAEEKCITTELSEKLQNLRNEFNKGFIQMYHNLGEKIKRAFVRYNEKKETYQVVFNSTNLYILNYKRHTLGGRSMCSDIIKVPVLV